MPKNLSGHWGLLRTRDWDHVTMTLQVLSLVVKVEPVQVDFTLRLRDQWSMDFCMESNGSRFVVTWTIFKTHLLEVDLIQKQEIMVLWTLTTIGLFYFIMCEDPHEHKFIVIAFGWLSSHIWFHTTVEDMWLNYMILEVCWDAFWTLFLLGSHNFTVAARVWSGPP